jgi:putative hydrolase of the HAD superfamily
MGIAAGVDSPTMLLRLLQGETIPPKLGEFEDNLVMLRFTDDLFLKANALASALVEPSTEKQKERSRTGVQAVLLDLDNTLYPEEEFVRGGFRAAAKCLADRNDLDPDALARRMLEILLLEGRGRVFDVLLEELHLPSDPWRKILLLAYRSHQPQIALYPETLATLNALQEQGIRLGIVTDGLASVQRRKIAALRLDRRMDVVVCTDELGNDCAKPSTVPFEVATTLLGVPPEHVAYVGDDMGKDFAGPNQLGMKTVCLRSSGLIGVPSKDAPNTHFAPQVRIESISQLLNTLELRSV